MSRSADYTIQGFIYQFNKTLLEILNSNDDAEIVVEGIIEDIEIRDTELTAIQCKYHESKDTFVLSAIYKPVLQMMKYFNENNDIDIKYRLYAYFPNEATTERRLTTVEIDEILATNNAHLKAIVDSLQNFDREAFQDRFTLEFGISLEDLTGKVYESLKNNNFQENDIESLIYPNAIQMISK